MTEDNLGLSHLITSGLTYHIERKDSYLRLVVWHMLHKRLIRKLLGTICNILC